MPSVQLAPLNGGLALLQIDRPPANAIDLVLLDELVGALKGTHAVRRLMLGNRLIDADECVRQGAFDEALGPARVLDRALEMARELAALDTIMYARTKLELRAAALGAMRVAAESDPLLADRVEAGADGDGGV
jgi:hypothetical protein